jgi:hypothetical protein
MPCTPPEFCVSNVTKSTFKKIREELTRGYALTKVSEIYITFRFFLDVHEQILEVSSMMLLMALSIS